MKKKNDLLRLSSVAAGAVFLFNPTVHIIDPLPDFIGFWLIAYGLLAVSYMSDRLFEARKNFIYLAFLEAAKVFFCLLVPGTTGTFVTLLTFCFCVAEMVLFLPAMSAFFDGFSSLGMRYGADSTFYAVLGQKKDGEIKRTSVGSLKIFTSIAFLVRTLGALLPTLPALSLHDQIYFGTSGMINWNKYVGIFYIVSWIHTLAVCIPWLIRFRKYVHGIAAEESFTGPLYAKYEAEVLSDKGRLCAERMKKVMILAVIATLLTFQFPIDYINSTPNLLSAAFVIAAFVCLMPDNKRGAWAGMAVSLCWAALSGIGVWLQRDYARENYTPDAAVAFGGEGRGMADELYFRMEIFSYIEAALFLASALIFARVFLGALNSHIAMMPPRRDGKERDAALMKKCLLPVGISGGVVILFNFALTFVTKYLSGAWIINGLAVVVLVIFSLLAYYKLSDRVYLPLKRKF